MNKTVLYAAAFGLLALAIAVSTATVVIGYSYSTSDVLFSQITAPSLATVADIDGYSLDVLGSDFSLLSGGVFDVFEETGILGVSEFTLTGIDPALALDPLDPLAFPVGVTTFPSAEFAIEITPITSTVPAVTLPAGVLLLLSGLAGVAGLKRRKKVAA